MIRDPAIFCTPPTAIKTERQRWRRCRPDLPAVGRSGQETPFHWEHHFWDDRGGFTAYYNPWTTEYLPNAAPSIL